MSKHEADDLTPASNFELNSMKLGTHTFQLVKGDRFTSNGATFDYQPSTAENKGKGHYSRYAGRSNSISAKKYQKDVLRADNIKLVVDRPLSKNEPPDSEYNVQNRWREWEVQYAYVVPKDVPDPLVIMVIEIKDWSFSVNEWTFKVTEHQIERETKETYFLKEYHPAHYRKKIERNELNKPAAEGNGTYHIIGTMADYNENEIRLFDFAEKKQLEKILLAKHQLEKEEGNLIKFQALKLKQGFK